VEAVIDTQFEDLLRKVLAEGTQKLDRTGVGTLSLFGPQLTYDLQKGFPLITSKFVGFKSVAKELEWLLSGESSIKWLQDNGVTIWNAWADENDDLGPIYGVQWRRWATIDGGEIDQIANAINLIKTNPDSRRIIVSAWNVEDLPRMKLEPCHALFQFYVADGKLSCMLYQRSADMFLGVPYNIASYSLLTHVIAALCDLEVGMFIWTGGDTHIYNNHLDQVNKQLAQPVFPFPLLDIVNMPADIDSFTWSDVKVEDYVHGPKISAPVAI
jgi:thymidylate synthase